MFSFRVSDVHVTSGSRPLPIFSNIKIIWISCEFLFVFFKFYTAVLTSAVYHEAACVFDLAKETILVTILDNITNSVFK